MTSLTFETPSAKCPARRFNGKPAVIQKQVGKRYVRRAGATLPVFIVQLFTKQEGLPIGYAYALGDELFIEPTPSFCRDERHDEPCPLPCPACEEECA